MKRNILPVICLFCSFNSYCCVTCSKEVREGIYDSTFYPNLLVMLSAFIVLAIIQVILVRFATRRYNARLLARPEIKELGSIPLTAAGAVLGIGLGGFADGIVLHQVLQWHEMLTNKIPADTVLHKNINMFWDGIFHFYTLIATILGIFLLWKLLNRQNINRSGYLLTGGICMGWGLFNIVEGIINHHLLKLHNVREFTPHSEVWNYGFLFFGALLLFVGWRWFKKGEKKGWIV